MMEMAYLVADTKGIHDLLAQQMTVEGRASCLSVIVFAHPGLPFVGTEIIPLVSYWNFRSHDYVHFFFVGYTEPGQQFEDERFVKTIEEFEQESAWEYAGQTPIIICRAILREDEKDEKPSAFLDLSTVIEFQLEKALRDGVIDSVESFFEALIRIVRDTPGDKVQWKLSDQLAAKSLGKAIVEGVFAYLPKGVKKAVKTIDYFRIKDKESSAPRD